MRINLVIKYQSRTSCSSWYWSSGTDNAHFVVVVEAVAALVYPEALVLVHVVSAHADYALALGEDTAALGGGVGIAESLDQVVAGLAGYAVAKIVRSTELDLGLGRVCGDCGCGGRRDSWCLSCSGCCVSDGLLSGRCDYLSDLTAYGSKWWVSHGCVWSLILSVWSGLGGCCGLVSCYQTLSLLLLHLDDPEDISLWDCCDLSWESVCCCGCSGCGTYVRSHLLLLLLLE